MRFCRLFARFNFVLILSAISINEATYAELGGTYAGVQRDQSHLRARLNSEVRGEKTAHTLIMPNGGMVKEFTNAGGQVYAVSWRGHGKPDLRQVLGTYFGVMQAEPTPRYARGLRHPRQINRTDIVIQSGGHPGAFWGVAYLPQAVPAGFSVTDVQ